MRRSWLMAGLLCAAPAWALDETGEGTRDGSSAEVAVAPRPATDGQRTTLSDEDRELMENLDLLEELEAAADLEVLLELSGDDEDADR